MFKLLLPPPKPLFLSSVIPIISNGILLIKIICPMGFSLSKKICFLVC